MPIYEACPDPKCQHDTAAERLSPPPPDIPSGRTSPSVIFNPYYTGRPRTPVGGRAPGVNRQEIIRRIKSRDDRSRPNSPELERQTRSGSKESISAAGRRQEEAINNEQGNMHIGMQIERPKSALHRGDFRERETSPSAFDTFAAGENTHNVLSTSPPAPWHPSFSSSTFRQAWDERRLGRLQPPTVRQRTASSQFVYQAPTSPLVQSSRPDTPPPQARSSHSPDKTRRHTFSPQILSRFASDLDESRRTHASTVPGLRKEATYPYQAHQPRRSIHSVGPSSPRSVTSRRPSASSEAHSPLHHAPLVGSYEESILRGRMSTTPSKPLNFIAQIGVLGKGDCKSSLRCPPHVTVPFPAVFYSYPAARQGADQPSPYVGLIDLEHDLPSHESVGRRRQRLGERLHAALSDEGSRASSRNRGEPIDATKRLRRQQKANRRSASPKAPPGGSYRIPQQGQLQIVIKNPNKTAVKLFLVPYDLSDMTPGQKTFIRQRSYSAGPIIDMPMSFRKNLGTDRPEASLTNSEDLDDRPVLRYLVHLHICCTGKGRYWLYKSLRVVFANRVPDGKEKLRNEIQLPEPRYSIYKANRDAAHISPPTSPTNNRGSSKPGVSTNRPMASSLPTIDFDVHDINTFRFPFRAPLLPTLESRPASSHAVDTDNSSDQTRSEVDPLSPVSSISMIDAPNGWSQTSRLGEPFLFARDRSHEHGDVVGESLISQELRRGEM